MAMTACYSNYGLLGAVSQRQRQQHQPHQQAQLSTQPQLMPLSVPQPPPRMQSAQVPQKDFSVPLHVDCSVEYELPNQAKPPPGARVEPLLLMIHPCYFRKIESEQRRSPFINNMPNSSRSSSTQSRRNNRNSQQLTQNTSTYSAQQNQSLHHNPNQNQNQNQNQNHNHSHSHSHSHSHNHSHNHHSQSMERQKLEQNPQIHQRSLSQQATQQQKMSQMSQQAYYPANNSNNANPSSINNVNTNNNNNNNNNNSNDNTSLADIRLCLDNWEHSQMAAIPRDFQAGLPDATPNNTYRDDKLNALNGKYRQYLRSHRLHPYLMSATAFPQLTSSVFH